MRDRRKHRKLSRKKAHREHLVRNLATQIFLHGRIKTSLAKAKTVQQVIDRLVTISKKDSLESRRYLQGYLFSKKAVENLLKEFKADFKEKQSGYTKILRLGTRLGDGSQMVILDLSVDDQKKSFAKAAEVRKKKEKAGEKEPKKEKQETEKKKSFWDRFKGKKKEEVSTKDSPKADRSEKEPTQRTTSK